MKDSPPLPLRKLFRSRHPLQNSLAWAGVVAGLAIVFIGLHLYLEFIRLTSAGQDWIDSRYLVVQKTVSLGDSLGGGRAVFSEEEIDTFGTFSSVTGIARFRANAVPTGVEIGGGIFPRFFSYVFLESVPDQFVDHPGERWDWTPDAKRVPVLIPTEFLNLYNFGFAPSQGLPQIPPSMVSRVPFDLSFYAPTGTLQFDGRIVGFSDRINTILVPDVFLEHVNRAAAPSQPPKPPARLLLEIADTPDPDLLAHLQNNAYQANREALAGGKIRIIARRIALALLALGTGVILLGILVVLLSLERQLEQSRTRLAVLFTLGHHPSRITSFFQVRTFFFIVSAIAVAYALHRLTGGLVQSVFAQNSEFSGIRETRWEISILASVTTFALLGWTALRIHTNIRSLYR